MTRSASRRSAIDPFHVMEVLRAARERDRVTGDVAHLEVGQPSTGAPAAAVEAAREALGHPDRLGYTDALGLPELRERIARHHLETSGITVDAGRIAVTTGASAGLLLTVLAAFDTGDRVGVIRPGYPCHRQILTALGCEPVLIAVDETTGFQPTPASLDEAHRSAGTQRGDRGLAGLILTSPSNPTGTVLDTDRLDEIARWCGRHDVRLVVDETYHGLTFGPPAPTVLHHDAIAPVAVHSFSKYFSMTGWRVGWTVLPEELVTPVERLTQNLMIAAPTLSQIAAIAAFDGRDELEAHLARYRSNRDRLRDGLAGLGLRRAAPADGAFYLYTDVSEITDDSDALARTWLDQLGVAVTPGIDFDPIDGHRWVRWSFAGSPGEIDTALARLAGWFDSLTPPGR